MHELEQEVLPQTLHVAEASVLEVHPLSPLQHLSMASQELNAMEAVARVISVNVIFRMMFLILDTFEAKLDSGV